MALRISEFYRDSQTSILDSVTVIRILFIYRRVPRSFAGSSRVLDCLGTQFLGRGGCRGCHYTYADLPGMGLYSGFSTGACPNLICTGITVLVQRKRARYASSTWFAASFSLGSSAGPASICVFFLTLTV